MFLRDVIDVGAWSSVLTSTAEVSTPASFQGQEGPWKRAKKLHSLNSKINLYLQFVIYLS